MFIGKAMGPLLSIFKNPYKNLTHQSLDVPVETIISEFTAETFDFNEDFIKVVNLATIIQFKLGTFNHDWELGQLDLTYEESKRHAIGIAFDVNLMYWYCLRMGTEFIPLLRNAKHTTEAFVKVIGEYIEAANFISPESFKGYIGGSIGTKMPLNKLEQCMLSGHIPIVQFNANNLTINMPHVSHEDYVKWSTVEYNQIVPDQLMRVKKFGTLIGALLDNFENNTLDSTGKEQVIFGLLYVITNCHRNDDIYMLSEMDRFAKEYYATQVKETNINFAKIRDSNLIKNANPETYSVSAVS